MIDFAVLQNLFVAPGEGVLDIKYISFPVPTIQLSF